MNTRHMKILIVDDERSNLEVLCRILKTDPQSDAGNLQESSASQYQLYVAKSGQAALKKANEETPDLILLDIIMSGMNGFEVLSALKASDKTRNIPVIFITGLDSVEHEEKGFRLGAVDYITKPFHSSLVRARVKTHLQIVAQMRTIEMLGQIDTLTGIPNRRGFDNQMAVEWGRALRKKAPLSLLLIDIDHFKSFNDTYGHQQGDTVLHIVANCIKSALKRPADFAARWGGEEFAVILPDTDRKGALIIAESIRSHTERAAILCDGSPLHVTVSVGVVTAVPDMNGSIIDFFACADKMLYAAKEAGRNQVCAYETE